MGTINYCTLHICAYKQTQLLCCTQILKLPGILHSKGALIEINLAKDLGIVVVKKF